MYQEVVLDASSRNRFEMRLFRPKMAITAYLLCLLHSFGLAWIAYNCTKQVVGVGLDKCVVTRNVDQ